MRISAKGRYALAAAVYLAQEYHSGQYVTVLSISEKLGISKIYLEQAFSLLKRGGIVNSIKGAQGGYQLSRAPQQMNVYEVLSAVDLALFERTEDTVSEKASDIETAIRSAAFDVLDKAVEKALSAITLHDLQAEAEKNKTEQGYMFFI